MNDVIDDAATRAEDLRTLGIVSYVLHTVVAVGALIPGVQASVLLLVAAFVLDQVKRGEAVGTWQESHFRWRLRSLVWASVLYLVTAPLWLLLVVPGWIAWTGVSAWFLYRIVRGWVALHQRRPMPMPPVA